MSATITYKGSTLTTVNNETKTLNTQGTYLEGNIIVTDQTEVVTAESPTVTPSLSQQVVTPGTGYNYLAQVTVNAIPYTETENAAGGITVTIG